MAQTDVYPVIGPVAKVTGGTTGPSSTQSTIVFGIIGGDDADGGIPATGGGGGGAGTPIGLLLAFTHDS